MSPDGLVSSFKREVIDKTPQTFKIACLTEVKNLFPINYLPFIAGFGNRVTDAVSYRAVGIELKNIFIINEKGEVTQLTNSSILSYAVLNLHIDEYFTEVKVEESNIKYLN
jgi:phosphatidate phosphatase LPIN